MLLVAYFPVRNPYSWWACRAVQTWSQWPLRLSAADGGSAECTNQCRPWRLGSTRVESTVNHEDIHICSHWAREAGRARDELDRWKALRKYQVSKRQSKNGFEDYKINLDEYLEGHGISWFLQVDEDIRRQGKLDLWKECYIYAHGRLSHFTRRLHSVQQLPERAQHLESRLFIAELNVSWER